MKTFRTKKNDVVEIYDEINEMPIKNYLAMQKMALLDGGLGSDLQAIDEHLQKIYAFVEVNDMQSFKTECENLRTNVFFIQNGINPKMYTYAAMVKSINGEENNDLSEHGLNAILKLLEYLSQKEFTEIFEVVKKKS